MIRHVVLFRFNADASSDRVAALYSALEELPHDVDGIRSLDQGTEFGGRADGYTHVLDMSFPDRASLAAFYDHPAHQQLVMGLIKPITEHLLVADFETTE